MNRQFLKWLKFLPIVLGLVCLGYLYASPIYQCTIPTWCHGFCAGCGQVYYSCELEGCSQQPPYTEGCLVELCYCWQEGGYLMLRQHGLVQLVS